MLILFNAYFCLLAIVIIILHARHIIPRSTMIIIGSQSTPTIYVLCNFWGTIRYTTVARILINQLKVIHLKFILIFHIILHIVINLNHILLFREKPLKVIILVSFENPLDFLCVFRNLLFDLLYIFFFWRLYPQISSHLLFKLLFLHQKLIMLDLLINLCF